MTHPVITVRDAVVADADGLCDAHVEGWRVAYRGLFPDAYLDSDLFDSDRRAWWHGGTWSRDPATHTFAGLVDDVVLGFASIGPERGDDIVDGDGRGEVYSFYMHPRAWGSGLAAALMDASIAWQRDRGFTRTELWVLRDNPRARSFYEKVGWSWTGRESLWAGPNMPGITAPHPVAEVRYGRTL